MSTISQKEIVVKLQLDEHDAALYQQVEQLAKKYGVPFSVICGISLRMGFSLVEDGLDGMFDRGIEPRWLLQSGG